MRVCLTRLQLDEYFVNFIQILKYNDIKNTCIRGGSDDESALIYNDWAEQYLKEGYPESKERFRIVG